MSKGFAIGILVVLASVGVIMMASQGSITGAYSWLTVKYESCHYFDQDQYGTCMRIERQVGPSCEPPEDAFRYSEGAYGWFIRPCTAYRGTTKF